MSLYLAILTISQLHFHVKQFWLGNLQLSLYLKIVRKEVRIVKYKIVRKSPGINSQLREKVRVASLYHAVLRNKVELQGVNHNCKKKKSELIAQKLQLPFYIFDSVVETSFHRFTSATTQNLIFFLQGFKSAFHVTITEIKAFRWVAGTLTATISTASG